MSKWTHAQVELLKKHYADTLTDDLVDIVGHSVSGIYGMANKLGLKKSSHFHELPESGRLQSGTLRGKSCRFCTGHQPFNKGAKGWDAGGRSAETRFKPGHLGGLAEQIKQEIGAERITKDGYAQRKVNDDFPMHKRWKAVHNIVWEEHNGTIPKGHIIVFKSANKLDTRIENLEMITRAENMKRNTIHRYPAELKSTIRLANQLKRKIHDKQN